MLLSLFSSLFIEDAQWLLMNFVIFVTRQSFCSQYLVCPHSPWHFLSATHHSFNINSSIHFIIRNHYHYWCSFTALGNFMPFIRKPLLISGISKKACKRVPFLPSLEHLWWLPARWSKLEGGRKMLVCIHGYV